MNMKKVFLQTVQLGLLLGLLLNPHLSAPSIASPDRSIASSGIDATYAVKNLLSSIGETFPDLTAQEALSRSALLGIISETEVQLHMYGTFKTVPDPDPKRPGRTMRVFNTDTTLNKITRSILDVLDNKLRSTVQASNPFAGINGKVLAKIMLIINTEGVQGLINALEELTPPKKKVRGKKGEEAPAESEELSLLDEWWESYRTSGIKGVFDKKKKFTDKILDNSSKKSSGDDIPFIGLLKHYAAESANDLRQANKQKEDLSKLLMTFLTVKDQKQKATGKSHAIEDYYTALLNKPFESKYYTAEELEQIGKTLLGQDSTHTIGKDAKGVEDTSAYLAHFIAGNVAFLQTPFDKYISPEKSFAYCAEATIRSLMNSLLYNPVTRKLDVTMLPLEIQARMKETPMGQKFLAFIEKYPDPTAPNYYGNSLKEWLDLVSGLDGVIHKNGEGKDAYEISAGAGPKNLVRALNHIFGTQADSFETFATAMEVKDNNGVVIRKVSFASLETGFNLEVTDHGKTVIQAEIGSQENVNHAKFTLNGEKIIDLLHNDALRAKISELSDDAKQDLYGIIFKPSTLNISGNRGESTPLIEAIQQLNDISLIKSMLAFGADPNFQGSNSETPLEAAAAYSENNQIAYELLKNGAHVTEQALRNACASGDLELVQTFIPLLEQNGIFPNYADMLLKASESHSLPIIDFLCSKGADINESYLGKTPLFQAIEKRDSLKMIQFLIDKGAHVTEATLVEACKRGDFTLIKILMPLLKQSATPLDYTQLLVKAGCQSFPLVEFLVEKGADLDCKGEDGNSLLFEAILSSATQENPASLIAKYLIKKGAKLTPSNYGIPLLSLTIQKGRADIAELLVQHGAELTPDILSSVINSKKFTAVEKIQLSKRIVEKDGPVTAIALKALNKIIDNEDEDDESLEELLPLFEQAYREQSFGLNLTAQEQVCITECITESV